MNINSTCTHISRTLIDSYLWRVQKSIMDKRGVDESYRLMDPLLWYVNTGRASVVFLGKLIERKPYMIARILMKGGSHDDVIRAIKNYIGYREEETA